MTKRDKHMDELAESAADEGFSIEVLPIASLARAAQARALGKFKRASVLRSLATRSVEDAARACGVHVDVVTEIVREETQKIAHSKKYLEAARQRALNRVEQMLVPQVKKAIEGSTAAVDAAATLMKLEQSFTPGLKVADKQEITGKDGGAIETMNLNIDADALIAKLIERRDQDK